ncbi:MAG TPA: hypothetical protein VKM72_16645 [Thermoanaerobaculia bacterium]|nr:hypothetical protein [Thermoanaerobaculia bacterium]
MGKNADKNPNVRKQQKENPAVNRSKGRDSSDTGTPKPAERERNVGHKNAEEHNKTPKGNWG